MRPGAFRGAYRDDHLASSRSFLGDPQQSSRGEVASHDEQSRIRETTTTIGRIDSGQALTRLPERWRSMRRTEEMVPWDEHRPVMARHLLINRCRLPLLPPAAMSRRATGRGWACCLRRDVRIWS